MMIRSVVQPLDVFSSEYDLVFAAAGYEQRSRFVCEALSPNGRYCCCYGFARDQVLSFQQNCDWFRNAGFNLELLADQELPQAILNALAAAGNENKPLRILVDISSQTRIRIAMLLDAILKHAESVTCEVDFAYALASYVQPSTEESVIATAGPVLDRFAGWSSQPEFPVAAIVGAGYEPDKVLGVLEYIEPAQVWVWIPEGPDARFLAAIDTANEGLWENTPPQNRITYSVVQPYETFVKLESMCFGLLAHSRPVLVPFGPKIFALVAMLVACHWPDDISVWRVSGEQSEPPIDYKASGEIVGIRAIFTT